MTKSRTITLEVGFEPRNSSGDALERAYQRLLPSVVGVASRTFRPSLTRTCHERSVFTIPSTPAPSAGRHLRPGLV